MVEPEARRRQVGRSADLRNECMISFSNALSCTRVIFEAMGFQTTMSRLQRIMQSEEARCINQIRTSWRRVKGWSMVGMSLEIYSMEIWIAQIGTSQLVLRGERSGTKVGDFATQRERGTGVDAAPAPFRH